MAFTYIIEFHVRPDQRERFLSLLGGVLDAMRAEPMFHEAVLHAHPEAADRFMLFETWEDHQDVIDVQLGRGYRQAWHAALPELLERPRVVAVWTPLRRDARGQANGLASAASFAKGGPC